jgi:transposase-like protein
MTGIRAASLVKLLLIAGERCESLMNSMRNVRVQDVQCDEIWGYVYKKEGHKAANEYENDSIGDCWSWTAIERNTKLILAFVVGRRTLENAIELTEKIRRATTPDRFQITTDGLQSYLYAVDVNLR